MIKKSVLSPLIYQKRVYYSKIIQVPAKSIKRPRLYEPDTTNLENNKQNNTHEIMSGEKHLSLHLQTKISTSKNNSCYQNERVQVFMSNKQQLNPCQGRKIIPHEEAQEYIRGYFSHNEAHECLYNKHLHSTTRSLEYPINNVFVTVIPTFNTTDEKKLLPLIKRSKKSCASKKTPIQFFPMNMII